MNYLITFLEGIISFISPCMLPMLPVYVSYFAGGADKKNNSFICALSFVLGFTAVFVLFGLFAGTIGSFFARYETILNMVCGLIIILFGLGYLEVIHIPFLKGFHSNRKIYGIFSAFVFGVVFSVSHTPCIGAFLGSAIMAAANSGTALKGVLLLLTYSLGMGIPFVLSAVLIDKLSSVFNVIKRHYKIINIVCGVFLIIVGILMMTGLIHNLLDFLEGSV